MKFMIDEQAKFCKNKIKDIEAPADGDFFIYLVALIDLNWTQFYTVNK